FFATFEQHMAERDDTVLWMSAEGALYHQAQDTDAPRWYGRWRVKDHVLHELMSFRLTCQPGEPRELELLLPLAAYPLSAARLILPAQIVDGDPAIARANRDALFPMFARARPALGLTASQARWHLESDFRHMFPDDQNQIEQWLDRLNAS